MTSASLPYPYPVSVAFHPGENVWLCLTTLHHRRFIEDAIHVVSLPHGTHMRLRYRRQYIDTSLWNHVNSGGSTESVFVLLALGATSSDERNVVRPLRKACIVAARCEGSVLIIDVVLREFLFDLASDASFWAEIQLIGHDMPAAFDASARGGTYLQQLHSAPQALSASNSVEGWEATATAFFDVATAASTPDGSKAVVPFLYHIAEPTRPFRSRLNDRGILDLEAGCSMMLEVHTMAGPTPGAFRNALGEIFFELSHPAATFSSSRRVRVDSRRDVRAVQITSPALFRRAHGHLSVRMVIFDNSEDDDAHSLAPSKKRDETVVSRYDYPLRVGRWTPGLASLLVAIAAGLATFKAPATLDSWHAYVIPGLVFVFALVGLMLGLRKDGKA